MEEHPLEECADYCGTNPKRMADYLERASDASSLDRIVSDDSDLPLVDCVSYDTDIMEELQVSYDRERMASMLHKLDPEDSGIIRDFFGIDRLERMTFSEMGKRRACLVNACVKKFNKAVMKLRTIYSVETRGGLAGL